MPKSLECGQERKTALRTYFCHKPVGHPGKHRSLEGVYWTVSESERPTAAHPASAPRPDTDSIQARVQKSRDLRADAGEEMIRVRGTAGATLRVPNDLPAWARSLDYEHDHVRWANAKLLELESALASRDAEIARLREALKAARASLAKLHVSDGSYPVYHLICDVLDHPARALAAPPDTTMETPHG